MNPTTLLLDLDDTLLDTNLGAFLPAYHSALARHLEPFVPPDQMLAALCSGVNQMLVSHDPSRTLQEVFGADFYPRLAARREVLEEAISDFYSHVFPTLAGSTHRVPGAAALVNWALAEGHLLALATDPLFPAQATHERVRWAGLDPDRFQLISSFESFHFSKSHPAYFAEMLGRLGWPDGPVVMAGNDVMRDLLPAQQLGLPTYHVRGNHEPDADQSGDLNALKLWLETGVLKPFTPPLKTKEAVLAMLEATPAVLHSMTADLSLEAWTYEASADDWAMIELICHLRDTEREVHALQLKTLLEAAAPFVSRPNAAVWAKQRRYLSEDGPTAIKEFTAARLALLSQIRSLPAEIWNKSARHAIFGPTSFLEVMGFMAEHDRLHLQQAWRTVGVQEVHAHRN